MDEIRAQAALVWYLHQPWVLGDDDVRDMIIESLDPLLAAHTAACAPVTLAITGALLERLPHIAPETLDRLRQAVESGLVEIAATFHHEIFPHLIDPDHLAAHVAIDIKTKQALLGVTPSTFLPANFAWTPALAPLLAEAGLRRVVLDERQLPLAGAMQQWKWHAMGPEAPLRPAPLPPSAFRRIWVLHGESGPLLELVFRDIARVEALSFGDSGAIHRPFDAGAQARATTALCPMQGLAVLADDGDRVNAVSINSYREQVAIAGGRLRRVDALTDVRPGRLDHLPGFALGDMQAFWLSGPESHHWIRTLDAVRRCRPDPEDREVLALHDVYPLFWRTHWRTRRFWERAVRMLS